MNILFTSVGRRYYLLKYFRSHLSQKSVIVSSNSKDYTLAKKHSDYFYISPKILSKDYLNFIFELVLKHKIKFIFPLFDLDIKILSKNSLKINKLGATLISPPKNVNEIISDKFYLYKFLNKNGLNYPKTYLSKNNFFIDQKKKLITYPVILKPRFGTGSILTFLANNKKEVNFLFQYIEKNIENTYIEQKKISSNVIIQEYLTGTEFGLDILNNINRSYYAHLLKEKIEMRNGETDIAKISEMNINKISKSLSKLIKHNFIIDVDLIFYKKNFYIIDINPRPGGGYPFTHSIGMDMVKFFIKQFNKKIDLKFIDKNFDKSIFFKSIIISK